MNVNCVRTAPTAEQNPLIATLEISANEAICYCFVPRELTSTASVTCGLQVTRCRVEGDLTSNITITRND